METYNVLILPDVDIFLFELIDTLYQKGYFGFLSTAEEYVADIYSFMEKELPKSHRMNMCKKANSYFNQYGENLYVSAYRRPKTRTTWYAFYEVLADKYFKIVYITNNHSEEAVHIGNILL